MFNKYTIPYILLTLCALFSLTYGVYAGEAQGSTGCVRFIDEKGGAISNLNIIFDVHIEDDMNSPPRPFIDGSGARTDSNGEYIFTQEALGKKRFWVVNDQVEGNKRFYRCSINLTKEYEPQPFEFVLADETPFETAEKTARHATLYFRNQDYSPAVGLSLCITEKLHPSTRKFPPYLPKYHMYTDQEGKMCVIGLKAGEYSVEALLYNPESDGVTSKPEIHQNYDLTIPKNGSVVKDYKWDSEWMARAPHPAAFAVKVEDAGKQGVAGLLVYDRDPSQKGAERLGLTQKDGTWYAGAHGERFLAASEIWLQDAADHSVKRYALDLPPASQNLPIPLKWE